MFESKTKGKAFIMMKLDITQQIFLGLQGTLGILKKYKALNSCGTDSLLKA